MNPDDVLQTLQKGFRVTLGATTALVESIQNPQRREENLAKLKTNPNQLADELAVKGEATEQEARTFVDGLLAQRSGQPDSGGSSFTRSAPSGPTASPEVQADLQDLTTQIAAMREELERLRQQDS